MSEQPDYQHDSSEIDELVDALISESINKTELENLIELIKKDPAAREVYLSQMRAEHVLRNLAQEETKQIRLPHVESSPVSRSETFFSNPWFSGIIVGLLSFSLIGICFLFAEAQQNQKGFARIASVRKVRTQPTSSPNSESNFQLFSSVARLTNARNPKWAPDDKLEVGSRLQRDTYTLTSGKIEITFDAGTVVRIAGQSKFEIVDFNEIRLMSGSLEATVPEQAIGFSVRTPSGLITDLSTEFGVKVSDSGESDVHVLKGLVEAQPVSPADNKIVTIYEKSAIRMFPDAPPKPVEFSPRRIVGFGSRNNPNMLNYVHFPFDEKSVPMGVIENKGPGGQGQGGRIVSGSAPNSWFQVDGKFNKGLFFSGTGAKVETVIQGIDGIEPRTIMFWVRINPDTPIESAYSFIAWGRTGRAEGHKWQIGWNPNYERDTEGQMGAVRTEFGGGYVIGSTDLRDGKWHHVASVFVGGSGKENVAGLIRHYVDGKLELVSGAKDKQISTESGKKTITIGEYIGMGEDVFTGYKGWIDEFYMFDGALTPKQIVQVMEKNEPPEAREIVAKSNN